MYVIVVKGTVTVDDDMMVMRTMKSMTVLFSEKEYRENLNLIFYLLYRIML